MKKKIVAVVITSVLFAGTVSASSINGDYKGNPIVKIKSNGQVLPYDDTPAIIYDDRTMVPIYMLKKVGAEVTWEEQTYSVNVSIPNDKALVERIRSNIIAADSYHSLEELGKVLKDTASSFEVVYNHYMLGTDPNININTANQQLNFAINQYNIWLEKINGVYKDLGNKAGDINGMYSILNEYYKAIDYFKVSYTALEKLSTAYSKENYNVYFNNASLGLDIVNKSSLKASSLYDDHIIQAKY